MEVSATIAKVTTSAEAIRSTAIVTCAPRAAETLSARDTVATQRIAAAVPPIADAPEAQITAGVIHAMIIFVEMERAVAEKTAAIAWPIALAARTNGVMLITAKTIPTAEATTAMAKRSSVEATSHAMRPTAPQTTATQTVQRLSAQ